MLTRRHFLTGLAAIPAVGIARAQSSDQQSDGFIELRAMPSDVVVSDPSNAPSKLWLYNEISPGPEIRVKRGQRVRVRFFNDLEEPSSIHWHGIRIANAMDGVPGLTQDPVKPGSFFDYDFVTPDAGTYWYHAHDHSWAQVGRGLYGPLIVDDDESTSDTEELTLILDDWRLDEAGQLRLDFDDYMREKHFGRIGETVTMDGGALGRTLPLRPDRLHRIRLINAANARIFRLRVRGVDAQLIALDGQYLEQPRTPDVLVLAPAQRLDLLVRIEAGGAGSIEDADGNIPSTSKSGESAQLVRFYGEDGYLDANEAFPKFSSSTLTIPDFEDALRVSLLMEGGSLSSVGSAMHNGKLLQSQQLSAARQVWKFNGTANLPAEPLFRLKRGRSVIVKITNQTGFEHAMHVHGHHFKVSSDGEKFGPWRDTEFMAAQSTKEIAFVADNPGKWLLHCHMLEHAAAGMRTWFEVV